VNATPVVLLSLWVLGRIPAVLNYTTGPAVLRACIDLAQFEPALARFNMVSSYGVKPP